MCGIAGITRDTHAGGTLRMAVDALKRLEYRGYDSFGVSVFCPVDEGETGELITKKNVGSVSENDAKGFFNAVPDGPQTIAHTRWATHGGVTEGNAHPHVSADGAFSLVHNGVIENYRELRAELEAKGVKFQSETDTETIVQLLAQNYTQTGDVTEALRQTLLRLHGEYGIVCATTHAPGMLFAARRKSPLGFALGKDEKGNQVGIVASDQRAVGPLASEMTFMEDGDVLVLSPERADLFHLEEGGALAPVVRSATALSWSGDDMSLGGYPHHMTKEIHEIPTAARTVFAIQENALAGAVADIEKKQLSITGVGSSLYVAQIGQYYFNNLAKTYARVHPSDEILSLIDFGTHDHLIAVSQSGETFDTLEVMRAAQERGTKVSAINNVLGSSSQRIADFPIFQGSGAEICVLSTKSLVSQTLVLYRMAKLLGRARGVLSAAAFDALTRDEERFAATLEEFFATMEKKIQKTGQENSSIQNWFFIGRGVHSVVATENALKFKEVSYLHAEGMPAGFFKHGTISLIDEHFYTVAFLPHKATDPEAFGLTMSNISEIHARGGKVIAIGHDDPKEVGEIYDYIRLPALNKHLDPLFELVTGQLLAYYCAVSLGRNIDKPRSLAKAVTVR